MRSPYKIENAENIKKSFLSRGEIPRLLDCRSPNLRKEQKGPLESWRKQWVTLGLREKDLENQETRHRGSTG